MDFLPSLWPWLAPYAMILPVPVILNLLAAPLHVLILVTLFLIAMSYSFPGSFILASTSLDGSIIIDILRPCIFGSCVTVPYSARSAATLLSSTPLVRESHLTTAKHDGHANTVSVGQEFLEVLILYGQIANVDAQPVFHLFHLDCDLFLLGFLLPLHLLVLVLSQVHDLANGWSGVGRHDDQVEPLRVRKFKSRFGRKQAQLPIVLINDADFFPAHSLVVNQI